MLKKLFKLNPILVWLIYETYSHCYTAALWLVYNNIPRAINYFGLGVMWLIIKNMMFEYLDEEAR